MKGAFEVVDAADVKFDNIRDCQAIIAQMQSPELVASSFTGPSWRDKADALFRKEPVRIVRLAPNDEGCRLEPFVPAADADADAGKRYVWKRDAPTPQAVAPSGDPPAPSFCADRYQFIRFCMTRACEFTTLGTAKFATFRVLTELARERRELTVAKF